ncbi:hypothetical protein FBBAL38_03420 [Flavobacteria bacterium BAL38]|nr:hypothetical protein FBBAL38_03420 [Flavobacteria bacterium BAL38]
MIVLFSNFQMYRNSIKISTNTIIANSISISTNTIIANSISISKI